MQSYEAFERFGGQDMLGTFAAIGGVRELYPVLAALICGSKIGAKVAASLANMRISEQIEALEVMAVDPMHRLIAPRMWAVTLAMPLLCVYADCIGTGGLVLRGGLSTRLGWGELHDAAPRAGRVERPGCWLAQRIGNGLGGGLGRLLSRYTIAKRDGAERESGVATNLAIVKGAVLCITIAISFCPT